MSVVFLIVILAVPVMVFMVRARYREYGPCPACQGRRGRAWGSTPEAWGRCRRCGGTGERIRPLALAWPKHRATARKLKEARKR